jgi:hypothetical protein
MMLALIFFLAFRAAASVLEAPRNPIDKLLIADVPVVRRTARRIGMEPSDQLNISAQTIRDDQSRVLRRAIHTMALRDCVDAYASGLDAVHEGLGDPIRKIDLKVPRVSNRSTILIGAGTGTTGTRSFYSVLKTIGLYGWHWKAPKADKARSSWFDEIDSILRGDVPKCRAALAAFDHVAHLPDSLDFILDTPAPPLFIHLFLAYPNAKFLLSTRPGDEWAESRLLNHPTGFASLQDPCQQYTKDFEPKSLARMHILHDELVRCVVPKNQLFEVNLWTDGEERMPHLVSDLAGFIGHPISNKDTSMNVNISLKLVGPKYGDAVETVETLASCPNCQLVEDRMYSTEEIGKLIYHNAKFDRELEFSGL